MCTLDFKRRLPDEKIFDCVLQISNGGVRVLRFFFLRKPLRYINCLCLNCSDYIIYNFIITFNLHESKNCYSP